MSAELHQEHNPFSFEKTIGRSQNECFWRYNRCVSSSFDLCSRWGECDGAERGVNFEPVGTSTALLVSDDEENLLMPYARSHFGDERSPVICYKRFRAFGDQYGCYLSRYVKSSNVLVMYASAQGERVFPGQVMRFIQFESSVPRCNSQVEQLAARPTAGAPPGASGNSGRV